MAIKAKNAKNQWSSAEMRKLRTLRYEGKSFYEIGRRIGRTETAVRQKWTKYKRNRVITPFDKGYTASATAYTPKKAEVVKVNKQTLKSMELDVKGIKIHMVFS